MKGLTVLCVLLLLPAVPPAAADPAPLCVNPTGLQEHCFGLQKTIDMVTDNADAVSGANMGWLHVDPANIRLQPLLDLPGTLVVTTGDYAWGMKKLTEGTVGALVINLGDSIDHIDSWMDETSESASDRAQGSADAIIGAGDAVLIVTIIEADGWLIFANAAGITLGSAVISLAENGPAPTSITSHAATGGQDYATRKLGEAVDRVLRLTQTPPPEAAQPDLDENGLGDTWEDILCRSYLGTPGLPPEACQAVEDTYHFVTSAVTVDLDGDGLSLINEFRWNVDPLDPDTDKDGLPDGPEANLWRRAESDLLLQANLWNCPPEISAQGASTCAWRHPDSFRDDDGDGSFNMGQDPGGPLALLGTGDVDSENDGLFDGAEYYGCYTDPVYGANSHPDPDIPPPLVPNTPPFVLCGGEQERGLATDPLEPDTDGDGLTDRQEVCSATGGSCSRLAAYGSDPTDLDTDGDGWNDGPEAEFWRDHDGWFNNIDLDDRPNNLNDPDSDRDGIHDGIEHLDGTRPDRADTDDDGMPDNWELRNGFVPTDPTDGGTMGKHECLTPAPDADEDGLCNAFEYSFQRPLDWVEEHDGEWQSVLDPRLADMDADGLPDGTEIFPGRTPYYFERTAQQPPDTPNTWMGIYHYGWDAAYPGYSGSTRIDLADTDGDGLGDGVEHDTQNGYGHYSNPNQADSDLDGLMDAFETGTDFADWDTDDDHVADDVEPSGCATLPDCDGDGLPDNEEGDCDPTNADSDDDGLWDGDEVAAGADCNLPDTDADGLGDYDEVRVYGTDPADPDSDDDGLTDLDEVRGTPNAWHFARHAVLGEYQYGSDRCTRLATACAADGATDPLDSDSDGDGLLDGYEVHTEYLSTLCSGGMCAVTFTNPNRADSDGDGIQDDLERFLHCRGGIVALDPTNWDMDNDLLADGQEHQISTDPCDPDTDKDFLPDGAEVEGFGTDPHDRDTDGDGIIDITDPHADREDNPPLLLSVEAHGPSWWNGVCISAADEHPVVVLDVEVTRAQPSSGAPAWQQGAWHDDAGAVASAEWVDGSPPHLCITFSRIEPGSAPVLPFEVVDFRITLGDVIVENDGSIAHNTITVGGHIDWRYKRPDMLMILEAVTCPIPFVGAGVSIVTSIIERDRIQHVRGTVELNMAALERLMVNGDPVRPIYKAFNRFISVLCIPDIITTMVSTFDTIDVTATWRIEEDPLHVDRFTLPDDTAAFIEKEGYAESAPAGEGTATASLAWRGEGYVYLQGKYPDVGTQQQWQSRIQEAFDTGVLSGHVAPDGEPYTRVDATIDGDTWMVYVYGNLVVDVVIRPG